MSFWVEGGGIIKKKFPLLLYLSKKQCDHVIELQYIDNSEIEMGWSLGSFEGVALATTHSPFSFGVVERWLSP